ncbi:HD domain-containing protein [Aceticella autotrophica]|uniref:HD domain-containing protein n=1 Tax=Aceticella autotrophica TaxID=2755338 RepID=A0A975GAS7_9THEO|nr:HD domain-containing phosphohydrolase [Aceticella autotrophica]QSZ27402.1 HD domain-containing protein [Aceticella autotrophica]
MHKNYRKRLFIVIFGISIMVYLLSFLHNFKTFGNNVLVSFLIILISLFISIKESKNLSKPIEGLNNIANKIAEGEYNYKIDINDSEEFIEISKDFNLMVQELKKAHDILKKRTKELIDKNNELQDFNSELEASYEQLEALTEELEKSEAKYRTLVDNMADILWYVDKEFNIEFVNLRVLRYMNFLPEEMIGENLLKFVDQKDADLLWDMMMDRINMAEINFIGKEGKNIITETRARVIRDEKDYIIGLQGISRDITDYYNAKNQILEQNREILTIGDITQLLSTNLSLFDILSNIAEKIVHLFKSPLCTIRTYNKESGKLELYVKNGELKDRPMLNEISLTEDDNTRLFISKEIVIKGIDNFPFHDRIKSDLIERKAYLIIIVPLISKNDIIGVMNILTSSNVGKNMNLLKSLSISLSIAIENARLYDNLKNWYMNTIQALAYAVEAKDKYTKGHSLRVSKYGALIGKQMGLSDDIIEKIRIAGILHDIGKIGISDSILTKPGKLTDKEYNLIKAHPKISRKILEPIGLSEEIMEGIAKHHERFDGKGYPYGLDDGDIPLVAAILCVADSLDAMTSDRSYRKGISLDDAINELLKYKGTQFNPSVVDSIVSLYMNKKEEIEKVKLENSF